MGRKIQMITTSCWISTFLRFFQTLHNFFTGAHNKVDDDVVNRICRDNNKPLGSNDLKVKLALIALDSRIDGAQRFVVIMADFDDNIIRNFVRSTYKNDKCLRYLNT